MSYPAIYRARAAANGGTLDVFVPQIFGDVPIKVTESVGGKTPGMGWVMFQGGDPAHPVWLPERDGVVVEAPEEEIFGLLPPGGTATQVLSKTTNDDYDTRWVNAASGGASDSAWKQPVRAATSPGFNYTFLSGLGIQADGVTLVAGDRVLLTGQTAAANNGIWIAASGNWARAPDCDTAAELLGATVVVLEGATNADTIWTLTNNAPFTLGTTALVWSMVNNEVWVGPDTPTNPNTELWYDTDEANLTDVNTARWNSSWGVIATADISAYQNLQVLGTAPWTVATGPLNVTTVAGRRYRITYRVRAAFMENSANGSIRVGMWDGATTGDPAGAGGLFDEYFYASIQFSAWVTSALVNGDGLAHAFRMGLLVYNNAGAARSYSTQFYIEDVGPVTQSSNPPLTPWSGLESAKPAVAAVTPGHRYFATDTQRDWLCDGTGWIIKAEPAQSYTPTLTNCTLGNGTLTCTYHRSDGWCDVYVLFVLGTTSAVATGPRFSYPFTMASGTNDQIGLTSLYNHLGAVGSAQIMTVAAAMEPRRDGIQISATSPFTWSATDQMVLTGRYRMASRYT